MKKERGHAVKQSKGNSKSVNPIIGAKQRTYEGKPQECDYTNNTQPNIKGQSWGCCNILLNAVTNIQVLRYFMSELSIIIKMSHISM